MAFAGSGLNRASTRDSAPGPRFFVFATLSLVLMYFDQREGWSERIRYALTTVAYPIQLVIGSPGRLWSATAELFQTRSSLRAENEALLRRERELALRTMRYDALEQENARLRKLDAAMPPLVTRSQLAEVVSADLGRLQQRLVINKGASSGLYRSQTIVDSAGLMGQLVRVGAWSAEVMLITDIESAVPVSIVRNGLRTVAAGSVDLDVLELPFVKITADVKVGDVLVTSGIGGVYPEGIPVGVITESRRDPNQLLLRVRARPRVAMDQVRQVQALWFNADHPAAPPQPEKLDLPPARVAEPVTSSPPAAAPAATDAAPQKAKP